MLKNRRASSVVQPQAAGIGVGIAAGAVVFALTVLVGCVSHGAGKPPIPTVAEVDLQRYAGAWFVVGAIPLPMEKDAYNAVETYFPKPDGSVPTVYRFRDKSFTGDLKTYNSVGFPRPETGNSVWGIQFIWPFRAEYRIAWLADDYSMAIVARNRRDYVWVLSRQPIVSDAQLADAEARIQAMGYDMSQFRRFPQDGRLP